MSYEKQKESKVKVKAEGPGNGKYLLSSLLPASYLILSVQ